MCLAAASLHAHGQNSSQDPLLTYSMHIRCTCSTVNEAICTAASIPLVVCRNTVGLATNAPLVLWPTNDNSLDTCNASHVLAFKMFGTVMQVYIATDMLNSSHALDMWALYLL